MDWKKERSRLWNVLLYPDDESHVTALSFIRATYHYVAICHDKDVCPETGELKKPHYHVIIKFCQARWNSSIADELGITPNYMQKTGSWDNSARYLLHDGVDEKYQYDKSELEGLCACCKGEDCEQTCHKLFLHAIILLVLCKYSENNSYRWDINRAIFVIIVNDLCSILKNYGISEAYLE